MKRSIHFSNVTGRESRFDATSDGALDRLHNRRKEIIDHQYNINWSTQEKHSRKVAMSMTDRDINLTGLSRAQQEEMMQLEKKRDLLYPKDDVLSTNKYGTGKGKGVSFTKSSRGLGKPATMVSASDNEQLQQLISKTSKQAFSRKIAVDGHDGDEPLTAEQRRKMIHDRYVEDMQNHVVFPTLAGQKPHVASAHVFDRVPGRDGPSPALVKDREKKRRIKETRWAKMREEQREALGGAQSAPLPDTTRSSSDTAQQRPASQLGEHLFPSIHKEKRSVTIVEPTAADSPQRDRMSDADLSTPTSPQKRVSIVTHQNTEVQTPSSFIVGGKRQAAGDITRKMTLEKESDTRNVRGPLFRSYTGREHQSMHQIHKEILDYEGPDLEKTEKGYKMLKERQMPSIGFPKAQRFDQALTGDEIAKLYDLDDEKKKKKKATSADGSAVVSQSSSVAASRGVSPRQASSSTQNEGVAANPNKYDSFRSIRRVESKSSMHGKGGSTESSLVSMDINPKDSAKKLKPTPHKKKQKSAYSRSGGKINVDLNVIFNSKRFKELLKERDDELEEANFPKDKKLEAPETYDEALQLVEKRERVDRLKHLNVTKDDIANQFDGSLPKHKVKSTPDLFLGPQKFDAATDTSNANNADPFQRLSRSNLNPISTETPQLPELLLEVEARDAYAKDVAMEHEARRQYEHDAHAAMVDEINKKNELKKFKEQFDSKKGRKGGKGVGVTASVVSPKKAVQIVTPAEQQQAEQQDEEEEEQPPMNASSLGSFMLGHSMSLSLQKELDMEKEKRQEEKEQQKKKKKKN